MKTTITTPVYREIETWLRTMLPERREGDLLPTVAEICERFGVSGVQTVRNAYQSLIEEGWVRVQQRPQRRWVVAKVPPARERDAITQSVELTLTAITGIEQKLRSALRELETLKGLFLLQVGVGEAAADEEHA